MQISVNYITALIGASLALPLADVIGYSGVILAAIVIAILATVLAYRYSRTVQHGR